MPGVDDLTSELVLGTDSVRHGCHQLSRRLYDKRCLGAQQVVEKRRAVVVVVAMNAR